jgi:hypothetical protein
MSFISGFLTDTAGQYTISTTENQLGEQIESLTFSRNIKVYFSPQRSLHDLYKLFDPGQIKVGEFLCISVKSIETNDVLLLDSVYYRVKYSQALKFKTRTLAYVSYLEHYKH